MAIQKTQGIVLKREELRETSIILTVYSRDFGKLKLISKGVRLPEQRFISAYELFAFDDIVFYERKKSGFFFLSQCELIDYFPSIRESLDRISYATYFIQCIDSVTPLGEKNRLLYDLLVNSLELLATKASPKRVARIFEIKVLSILGFMPRLKTCANCGKGLNGKSMRFSLSSGGVLCGGCLGTDKKAQPVLAGTVNFISHIEGLPFEKVKMIKVSARVGSELERLLENFIGYHLDIRLKSRDFIRKVNV